MLTPREQRKAENRAKHEAERAAQVAKWEEERKARQEAIRAEEAEARKQKREEHAAHREALMAPKPASEYKPAPEHLRRGQINDVLTPELITALAQQVHQGMPYESAARALRVPVPVLYAWVAQGVKDIAARQLADELTLCADLVLTLDEYGAMFEGELITQVRETDRWNQGKWILEQRNPDGWGKQRVEVDVNVRSAGMVVFADAAVMSDAQLAEMREAAQRKLDASKEARRLAGPVIDAEACPVPTDGVHQGEE